MKVSGITGKADGGGSNRERRLDERLPDEEKGHEAAPAAGTVGFAKENIGAAGFGHGGAELGPDETVECGEKRAGEPGDKGLRPAHGFDDEGADDERADADDFDHVEGDGFFQAEAALERGLRLGERRGWRGRGHEERE